MMVGMSGGGGNGGGSGAPVAAPPPQQPTQADRNLKALAGGDDNFTREGGVRSSASLA